MDRARKGVDGAKVPLGPYALEALKVRRPVLWSGSRSGPVVPEKHGHVGEGRRGDEIACLAGRKRSAGAAVGEIVVKGGDGDAQGAVLAAADVDGIQGVLLGKSTSLATPH
jgi:hypothetical protein